MQARIAGEVAFLCTRFPDLEYRDEGQWVCIPTFPATLGWIGRPRREWPADSTHRFGVVVRSLFAVLDSDRHVEDVGRGYRESRPGFGRRSYAKPPFDLASDTETQQRARFGGRVISPSKETDAPFVSENLDLEAARDDLSTSA